MTSSLATPAIAAVALLCFTLLGCVHATRSPGSSVGVAASTLRRSYGLPPTVNIQPTRTALLLVDLQREFLTGRLPVPGAEEAVANARRLLEWARTNGVLVVFVRQVAARPEAPFFAPGTSGIELAPGLEPRSGELVITKSAAGAFSRTGLDADLKARGITQLVVAGIMTHLAVDTTARDGTVLGYDVLVATDATATRTLPGPRGEGLVDHATLQRAALAALADRFAELATTEEVLALPLRQ